MRKTMWSAAAPVVLVVAASVLLTAPTVQAADTVTMGSSADPYALKFFPAEITVQVGSSVVWQNLSDLQHDVSADNGAFKSELLNKNEKFEFKFTAPGDYTYVCTPHKESGMKGVVHVAGGAAITPTTVAGTTTTAAAGGTTPTPAPGQTTTTTRAGASAAGQSTTTTTAPAAGGVTSTTQAPSVTPTSASDSAGQSTATTAAAGGGDEAAADHNSEGAHSKKKEKNSPIGIAFASVSTLLLVAIAGKLLASKP